MRSSLIYGVYYNLYIYVCVWVCVCVRACVCAYIYYVEYMKLEYDEIKKCTTSLKLGQKYTKLRYRSGNRQRRYRG